MYFKSVFQIRGILCLEKNNMHHRGNTLKSRALATYASVPLLSEGGVGDTSYSVK